MNTLPDNLWIEQLVPAVGEKFLELADVYFRLFLGHTLCLTHFVQLIDIFGGFIGGGGINVASSGYIEAFAVFSNLSSIVSE